MGFQGLDPVINEMREAENMDKRNAFESRNGEFIEAKLPGEIAWNTEYNNFFQLTGQIVGLRRQACYETERESLERILTQCNEFCLNILGLYSEARHIHSERAYSKEEFAEKLEKLKASVDLLRSTNSFLAHALKPESHTAPDMKQFVQHANKVSQMLSPSSHPKFKGAVLMFVGAIISLTIILINAGSFVFNAGQRMFSRARSAEKILAFTANLQNLRDKLQHAEAQAAPAVREANL